MAITYSFLFLTNSARDESCWEKLKHLEMVGSLWFKQILVYIDEDFTINWTQSNYLSPVLTGKFCRGVAEKVHLKRIFTGGEYAVIHSKRIFTSGGYTVIHSCV